MVSVGLISGVPENGNNSFFKHIHFQFSPTIREMSNGWSSLGNIFFDRRFVYICVSAVNRQTNTLTGFGIVLRKPKFREIFPLSMTTTKLQANFFFTVIDLGLFIISQSTSRA